MKNNHAIIAENVVKHFGDVKALDGVSIAAETGKILGSARTERRRQNHAGAHTGHPAQTR